MRIDLPDYDTMTTEQRQVHDAIAGGPRGGVRGPLAVWLHRPGLAAQAQALGQYCRYDSSLPPRLSELAILIMATLWQAEYEWWAHEPHALRAGVDPAVVEALRQGETPVFAKADEAVVHTVMTTLHADKAIPQALYDQAIDTLGRDRLIDLIGLAGYYTLISMTIKVFEVPVPPN